LASISVNDPDGEHGFSRVAGSDQVLVERANFGGLSRGGALADRTPVH